MADMITSIFTLLVAVLISLFSGCDAGNYCSNGFRFTKYCRYGCCYTECCTSSMAMIIGLCVGGAVLLFVTILVICICKRRRGPGGIVFRQPDTMVIQQSTVTTNGGVVNTSGVQPGYVYPPYPGASYGQVATPYTPYAPYMAGPPLYTDVTAQPPLAEPTSGGLENPAFNKN